MLAESTNREITIEALFANADTVKTDLATVKQTIADLQTLTNEIKTLVTALTLAIPAPAVVEIHPAAA